ncbi:MULTISPECIES: hypothetical protein [Streptomyces]|uniref:Uncharacterized protein n=2 Tax=Streptomyces TaxID=1883 RepID=A0A100Y0R0_9ACTN|nr:MULTISPECIES: hypothetical protein [Streptomyces]KUH35503.1 hypothetical protein ATE80_28870 [Streptomyces kanasensis]UUS33978.1 hypothetical protein NRO40_26240 [Streptomyces changanensis]
MTESVWHKEIKDWGVAAEVTIGNRRADCILRCGKRAEVQAYPLARAEVAGREAHTDLWILDGRAAHAGDRLLVWDDSEFGTLFRWDRAWQGFAVAKRPVFLNVELEISTGHGRFLEVTGWAFDGYRALGSGRPHTASAIRSWMRYDIPLTGHSAVPR